MSERDEKLEAIKTASEYCAKLEIAIDEVSKELRSIRLDDTKEYLDNILNGINWTFQVYNAVKDILRETELGIDESKVNVASNMLSEGFRKNDDLLIADALTGGILEFVVKMKEAPKYL